MWVLICTVLFCLGWRIVTDKGQLLYFLKEWFDFNYTRLTNLQEMNQTEGSTSIHDEIRKRKRINYFAKPFILCITCMASIWGVIVFYFAHLVFLQPFGQYWLLELTFNCIAASFIQTFIWELYEKL